MLTLGTPLRGRWYASRAGVSCCRAVKGESVSANRNQGRVNLHAPVHRPIERDGRAADGPLLEPLRVTRLLVQMRHTPHQIRIDEDDVGSQLLAALELEALGRAVLDRDALDGAVEAELGAALFGELLEGLRDAAEAAERVEDAFAVLGVLEEVVGAESVEGGHALRDWRCG